MPLPVLLLPSLEPASIPQRRDIALQWTGTSSTEQHWMDDESILIKLAEESSAIVPGA
jgi:hypothetical protein